MSSRTLARAAARGGIGVWLGLTAVALAGCGDDDTAATSAAAAGAEEAPLTIGLRDYAFDGVPRTITTGVPIAATNTSASEAHELTAFRLPDGETRALAALAALPPEELGALMPGAPVLAIVAPPGTPGQVVLGDGTLPEPGRYLLVCFVPVGADPDQVLSAMQSAAADPDAGPPQIAGGPPHLTAGMIAEIEVIP